MKKEISFNDENGRKYCCFCGNTFNKGKRYLHLLSESIKRLGVARGIVVDKENNILCGTKTAQMCCDLGIKRAKIIETNGDELIIIKRVDVEADSTKACEISLTDNLIASKILFWDADAVLAKMQERYSFDARMWEGYECITKELDISELLRDDVEVCQSPVKSGREANNSHMYNTLSLFD
jgi:hypothetical protein